MTSILLGRICRTCLQKSTNMHKLRESIQDTPIEVMLQQTIPNFDLDMEDVPLPVEICKECLRKLETSYGFVKMCAKSNKELKNILNQQEQEIEGSMVSILTDINPMDVTEETDILMDNFKKEPLDDNSNNSGKFNENLGKALEHPINEVKLEELPENESPLEDEVNSSDEYWPEDDKQDSDRYY